MITVTGGKLTTYRKMAQDAVDTALLAIGRRSRCKTKSLSLVGATTSSAKTSDAQDQHLLSRFGSESKVIKNLIADDKNLGEQLIPGLPYLRAEAVFAVTHELATTLDDILSRRTRCRIINRRATVAGARNVAELVAPLLGWSEQEINNEVLAFVDSCAQEDEAAISN
jgi:glycerol-3-phosphate dehydrogenase